MMRGLMLLTCGVISGVVAAAQAPTHFQALAVGGDGTVWAGTFGQGLWKSTDEARTWSNVKLPDGAGSRVLAVTGDLFGVAIGTESTGLWVLPGGSAWHRAEQ